MALPYWRSEHKWRVRGMTLALVLLTLAQVGLAVWISYWNRELFDVLERRSLSDLVREMGTFVLIFLLTMLVTALHMYVKRWLQLGWRQWLTDRLLNQWMGRAQHYQLQFTRGEHDNPDGRIAEDIRIATESAIGLSHSLLYSLLILGSFIDILLALSGSAPIPGTNLVIPGYLVLLAFLYAGAGILLGLLLGRPLSRATNRLQTAEANFRFGLGRAREHSEAIAQMRGEGQERKKSAGLFAQLRQRWDTQTLAYLGIVSFSTGYGALLPVFPILLAAPQYIAGALSLGMLMQAALAFQRLTSALSWPIDNLGELAKYRASADRVSTLYEDLQLLEARAAQDLEHRIHLGQDPQGRLRLVNLCLASPEGEVLLEGLNLEVQHGERVLICGDPQVTIALFKAVSGLWPWGHGAIELPAGKELMFMPQRPFLPEGPLREVLCYPEGVESFSEARLHRALECAGLSWLMARLDDDDSWDRVLPLRAQQRLGMARLFLHRPAWVFLEEATDAFDPKAEDCMIEDLLREMPDITLLSISFHVRLEHHYQRKLVLNRLKEPRYLVCASVDCALGKL